ncbi:MAG: type I-C CRISPR-associated protein Cas8c/Csd1 [Oscillospiraceae bacterium]|nr:type I-C CRISPR-associated protein Cas8c/Csd1 [Oscillospiraceae bacterium]
MLTELADYAYAHDLAALAGYKNKALKGYIHLSKEGEFLGIERREKDAAPVYAPDIGSAANGTRYCNPLIEKAKIPLCIVEDDKKDKNVPVKHDFFLSMLENGESYEPSFRAISCALRSEEVRGAIIEALGQTKLKGGDPIGFVVDGVPAEKLQGCFTWWKEFRTMFDAASSGDLPRCLVTGELAPALTTVPKVSGLLSVGGHTSGDAFLCFDKDAFQSYGLKQSANAAVSEEGITAVNAALAKLISEAPVFGGAKLLHWYAGDIPESVDPFRDIMDGFWGGDADDENELPSASEGPDSDEAERNALNSARQLLGSVRRGERPPAVLSARYYIMPLSGAGGRMMVRGWYEGSFETLCANVNQWFDDLLLVNPRGTGWTKPPKLNTLCTRLLKPGGDPKKEWERVDKELANLSGRLLDAIINGNPLPDEVAARALRYIRSGMLTSNQETGQTTSKQTIQKESMAFQLLKAWLVRHQRRRGEKKIMGTDINTSPRTVAYCCGQLMAVYNTIQLKAMPDVNVTVAERYYAAASATPAFVIGKLAQLSQHHLSKLEEKGLSIHYQKMLDSIYAQIGQRTIPTTLNQEQQTEFALGYYQQRAAIYTPAGNK